MATGPVHRMDAGHRTVVAVGRGEPTSDRAALFATAACFSSAKPPPRFGRVMQPAVKRCATCHHALSAGGRPVTNARENR